MNRVVVWDFDGTLAFREGIWSGCLVETLDEHEPGHAITRELVRPFLRAGFPWHEPDLPHPELADPALWWARIEGVMAAAYESIGYEKARANELARLAHERYIDLSGWSLFEDVVPVLGALKEGGWRHIVLSNHVPELPALVEGLALADLIEEAITSAVIGYEKPRPEAFAAARRAAGATEAIWMVGDNPEADVRGAERAGIPAILVRRKPEDYEGRFAEDLHVVQSLLEKRG